MNIQVRQAKPEDGKQIVDFNAAIAFETENIQLDKERLARGVWAVLLDPFKGQYFVAEDERGTIVGQLLVTYEWSDWRDGVIWWLQSIYVDPQHRRKGVLKELITKVLAEGRTRREVCGYRLYVEKGNEVAQHAYELLGFNASHYQMFEFGHDVLNALQ